MALINITFGKVGGAGGPTNWPPLFRRTATAQTITSAATSTVATASAPFTGKGENSAVVRLYSDVGIYYDTGPNPDAAGASHEYLPAGGLEWIYVTAGDKIAVREA